MLNLTDTTYLFIASPPNHVPPKQFLSSALPEKLWLHFALESKPIKKAYEQNPGKVRHWLKEEYPAIAAQAKADGAEIYWGDQTGVNNQR